MKVLILDDDELTLKWLKDLFVRLGATEVYTVQNVEDFQFQLSLKHFDLCVLDVLLPGSSNGVEIIDRCDIDTSRTAIWFVSGVVKENSFPESVRSKMSLFLSKPINESLVISEFQKIGVKGKKSEGFLSSFYEENYSSVDVLKLLKEQKTITDHQLAVLYSICALFHFSGNIVLKNEQTSATLFFSKGHLIRITSPHKKSYLGVLMAAYDFASAQDIKKVLQSSKPGLTGEKLVKYGFVSPHSLHFILKEQTKIRLSELIQKDISYSIEVQKLSLNTMSESFNLDDMRMMLAETLWSKIDASWIHDFFELKNFEFVHRSTVIDIGNEEDQIGWIKKCKGIISLIKDGDTVSRIVHHSVNHLSLKKEEVQFCLYYMLITKLIYLKRNSDEGYSFKHIEEKLIDFQRRMKTQNYYELLNLHINDSAGKIKDRMMEVVSLFHPDQYQGKISELVAQQCHGVILHVNKIKGILLDDSKRQEYIKGLQSGFQEDVVEGLVQFSKAKNLIQKKEFSSALSVLESLQNQKGAPPVIHLYYCWMYMKVFDRFKSDEDKDKILYKIECTSVEDKYSYLYHYCKALFMMQKGEFYLAKQLLKRCLNLEPEFIHAKVNLVEVEQSLKQGGFFKSLFKAS